MTPLMQTIRHDPANGRYGNCHQAVLASILDLALDDVPHIYDNGASEEEGARAQHEFLISRGLTPINVCFDGGCSLADVLMTTKHTNPGTHAILGGMSPRGYGHSVVILDGKIVHDPHPEGGGLVAPFDNGGGWWVTWIGAAIARAA